MKPALGEIELPLCQWAATEEGQGLVRHHVPGRDGGVIQRLSRDMSRIRLAGVMVGAEARQQLEGLRRQFQAAEPIEFIADVAEGTTIQQVVIAELNVEELAGKPERFAYRLLLEEFVAPPPTDRPASVDDDVAAEAETLDREQDEAARNDLGTLLVRVEPPTGESLDRFAVVVEGTAEDGKTIAARVDEPTEGVFRLEGIPAGDYKVKVVTR